MNSDDLSTDDRWRIELQAELIEKLMLIKSWRPSAQQDWSDYVLTDREYREFRSAGTPPSLIAKESRKAGTSDTTHVLLWTSEHEFHITIEVRNPRTKATPVGISRVSDLWLMLEATARKPRPGSRQSDPKTLLEGKYSDEMLQRAVDRILGYGIVAKPKGRMGRMSTCQLTRNYTCFAGADIKAMLHGKVVGKLVGISYTVTREVIPLYSAEGGDPQSFAKGKRGIAGTLVFQEIDVEAIKNLVDECETPSPHEIPFDIEIVYGDAGCRSSESLLGVQILDEGEGGRVDKAKPGLSYTFVCRKVTGAAPTDTNVASPRALTFQTFDKQALIDHTSKSVIQAKPGHFNPPEIKAVHNDTVLGTLVGIAYTVVYGADGNHDIAGTFEAQDFQLAGIKRSLAALAGESARFDVTFVSPQGVSGRLHDIQIVSQGTSVSVDDLTCDVTCVFKCKSIEEHTVVE